MKTCPTCHKTYEDESVMFCLDDGAALLQAMTAADPNATLLIPEPRETEPGPTVANSQPPTVPIQPVQAQADSAARPTLGASAGAPVGKRKSPLPWILGIVIALGLLGIGIAFMLGYALQRESQQSAQTGTATPSLTQSDITTPVSSSSVPANSSNSSQPPAANSSSPQSNSANARATPTPKPTIGPAEVVIAEEPPPPTPKPTPHAPISAGVLNGKALSLPKPQYPAIARQAHASGTVMVQVLIDEAGNVIAAHAISGHPLLQAVSVQAARQAKFSPTRLSGQPVKVNGVIQYNFVAQ